MKSSFTRCGQTLGVFLLTSLLFACNKPPYSQDAKILQIPWPTAAGDYTLQKVPVETFTEPEALKGTIATIYVQPFMDGGELKGELPVGRYARADGGVLVPADFETLQAATIYAHFERLSTLDKKAGSAPFLRLPARIGLEVEIQDSLQNNALYDGVLDALLIVPFSASTLPISLNGGILAHEHFHAIFHALVLNHLTSDPVRCTWADVPGEDLNAPQNSFGDLSPKDFNDFLIRGINEGLADFWGWVYTGDAKFIGRSLEHVAENRRLDRDPEQLPDLALMKRRVSKLVDAGSRYALSYSLGTFYARFMKKLTEQNFGDTAVYENRLQMAKVLVAALPALATSLAANYQTDFISPNVLLKPVILALPNEQLSCDLVTKFSANEGKTKPLLCQMGAK